MSKSTTTSSRGVLYTSGLDMALFSASEIISETKQKTPISNLWIKHTAILIFLSHFACVACRTHTEDVWLNREKYEKVGCQLYFIGNGGPEYIKIFRKDMGIPEGRIFTDPTLKTFHYAGFRRGFVAAYGAKAMKNIVGMYLAGQRDGLWMPGKGDLWQVGGVLAVKHGGTVAYHHISEIQGDFPPEAEINDTPWISKPKSKGDGAA